MELLTFEEATKVDPEFARRALRAHGKRRSRLRRQVREAATIKVMLAKGLRCINCSAFRLKGVAHNDKPWCAHHSDFHGTQLAQPDGLCLQHHPKTEETAA